MLIALSILIMPTGLSILIVLSRLCMLIVRSAEHAEQVSMLRDDEPAEHNEHTEPAELN